MHIFTQTKSSLPKTLSWILMTNVAVRLGFLSIACICFHSLLRLNILSSLPEWRTTPGQELKPPVSCWVSWTKQINWGNAYHRSQMAMRFAWNEVQSSLGWTRMLFLTYDKGWFDYKVDGRSHPLRERAHLRTGCSTECFSCLSGLVAWSARKSWGKHILAASVIYLQDKLIQENKTTRNTQTT